MSVTGTRGISNKLLSSALKNVLKHQNCPRHLHMTHVSKHLNNLPELNLENLQDPVKSKVALVTGCKGGMGYHIADQLLEAEAEAVILADTNLEEMENTTSKLNEKYGESKALFQPTDMSQSDEMIKLFKCTKERFNKIDIVINNAEGNVEENGQENVKKNVKGLVQATFLGFDEMFGEGGVILNSSSILEREPMGGCPIFSRTNQFVIMFSRSLSQDYFYKPSNVKVIAVCPDSPYTQFNPPTPKEDLSDPTKECVNGFVECSPQKIKEYGQAMLTVLKDGENGCAWIAEGGDVYKINNFYSSLISQANAIHPQTDPESEEEMELAKPKKPKKGKKSRCEKKPPNRPPYKIRDPMRPPPNSVPKKDPCAHIKKKKR